MKDRVPSYPGRVKLTQVSGNIYDLEMADQPTEQGTPLNKATLLQDSTANKYGFSSQDNPTPDDAFNAAFDAVPTVHLEGVWTSYGPQRYDATNLVWARSELAGASVGSYALFAGGRKADGSAANTLDYYYSATLGHGSAYPLSVARYGLEGANVGNYALFAGGYPLTDTVDAYTVNMVHTTPTALSEARYDLASAKVGNYAIFAGGITTNGNKSAFVDAYNASLTRSRLLNLNQARSSLAGASVGNYALFASGTTESDASDIVDAYNTSLSHSTATALSSARSGLAGASVGDYAIFAGGSVVDTYNTALTHNTATSLSVNRYSLAGASLGDYALFAGGTSSSADADISNTVDTYDSSLTHNTATSLSEARYGSASAKIGDYAIFAGGATSIDSDKSNAVDAYKVAYGLSVQIPAWSRYKISDVTTDEQFTKYPVEIDAASNAPFTGYIKRGFTISGQI